MTSGARSASPGSLLDQCSGKVVDYVHFEPNGRTGIVRVAFPLKMLLHEDGGLHTTDILHITGGEGAFGLTEHADIKLVWVDMSDESLNRFPGPAHGAPGVRRMTGLADGEVAFGTILKPCTGITPAEESAIISQAAANPLFIFVKEDENFLPRVSFAPLRERVLYAREAIERARERRRGKGLIFAPHVGAPPEHLPVLVDLAAEAGMNGIMFSEYYTGGAVRMAREQLRCLPRPPVIYGHNGGISCRTRQVYREVLDYFARLDGVDFRQTAPLSCGGESLLRPVGLEWRKCEEALSRPAGSHPVVMMARAGGLDQGNIIQNLMDVSQKGSAANYLFLAGSAINGIKNKAGAYDPHIGALAMEQALQVFRKRVYTSPGQVTPRALASYASANGMPELADALRQRYRL